MGRKNGGTREIRYEVDGAFEFCMPRVEQAKLDENNLWKEPWDGG